MVIVIVGRNDTMRGMRARIAGGCMVEVHAAMRRTRIRARSALLIRKRTRTPHC